MGMLPIGRHTLPKYRHFRRAPVTKRYTERMCLIRSSTNRIIRAKKWPMRDPHDSERRRYPRVKAKLPVELLCSNMPTMRTATDEISLCGCYIETMFTMDVGTKLALVFSIKDEKIGTNGVVATKYPQVGNGIDFVDIAPQDRLKLSEFISGCEQDEKT